MLKWQNQWGSQQKFLLYLASSGEDVPALKSKPTLTIWQFQFWAAFTILSDSRNYTSAGIAPIPLTEMQAYFSIYNIIDAELRELHLTFIRALDEVFLEHSNKKS